MLNEGQRTGTDTVLELTNASRRPKACEVQGLPRRRKAFEAQGLPRRRNAFEAKAGDVLKPKLPVVFRMPD